MKTEFRNRAFLPVVLPLAILGGIAAVVGIVATILLFVDRQGAVAIALLGAAGILVAISLAASQDRLDPARKGAIVLAGVAPLAVGALIAAGVVGGVPDEERNINVEPHAPQFIFPGIDGDPPVMAAEDATSFCLPEDGGCTPTNEWEFSYTPEQIQYAFDNQDTTAQHNLQIFNVEASELEGATESPLDLTTLQDNYQLITPGEPTTFQGPQAETYRWAPPGPDAGEDAPAPPVPEQAYFVCTIHPGSMYGVVTLNQGEGE